LVEDDVWKRAADQARRDVARADRRRRFSVLPPDLGFGAPDLARQDEKEITAHGTETKD
jgi:hypothetical protein